MIETTIDTVKTAKLQLAVARFGEMDRAKWWNTKGMLTNLGELAISRGFTKTHLFARARAVLAVAAHRCDEVFNAPDAYTLWKLPAEIEDQIEDAWTHWLERPDPWREYLERVNELPKDDLLEMLQSLELIDDQVVDQARRLKRADDFRSVPLPRSADFDNETIQMMAAGFFRGEPGRLAVPYMQMEGGAE
jgi:hypothetical protein